MLKKLFDNICEMLNCHIKKVGLLQNSLLYECYNENHPYDNEEIKSDFNALYQAMNGMPLQEMGKVIYPVCKLCRDHERAGFAEGIKVGIRLAEEIQ